MENEKTNNDLEDPPACAAVYGTLPRAADAAGTVDNDRQPQRPSSVSTRRGQSAPARLLTQMMSTGADDRERRRLVETTNEVTTSTSRINGGFRSMRELLRVNSSITHATRSPVVDSFRCYICFEDVPVAEAVTLLSCGHRFCKSCFQSYLTNQISDGHVHPVCFHPCDGGQNATPDDDTDNTGQLTCGVAVADDQIQSIVHADVWTKFNKFRFNQKHQHARECPHCSFTQECAGPSNPSCVCSQCEKPFCFFHGNAHEYGTCGDYELKNAEAEALNRAVINKLAKPCPGCSRDIEKNGGCNHMTCVACQTSFCWLCGEEVESVPFPSHFQPGNDGSCSGKQYDGAGREHRREDWVSTTIAYGISLGLVYALLFPLMVVTTLIVWLFSRDRGFEIVYEDVQDKIIESVGFCFFWPCFYLIKVVVMGIEFALMLVLKLLVLLVNVAYPLFT